MAVMHNLSAHMLVKSSFNAAIANSTQNGVAVDCLGYRRAALVIDAVTGSATTVKVGVQESDDGSTNWSATITGTFNPATPQAASIPASGVAGAPYVTDIDLAKRKRYLRAVVVGTGAAGQVVADFVLFGADYAAPAQDNTVVQV